MVQRVQLWSSVYQINKQTLAIKNQFDERKQDWLVQKFGFKVLMRFRKILFSSLSIKKKRQGGSTRFPFLHNAVIKIGSIRSSPLQRDYKQELRISFLPSSPKNPFTLLTARPILVLLRWLTNQSRPGQCYTSSSSAPNSPIASTVRMTDFPSPVFGWR